MSSSYNYKVCGSSQMGQANYLKPDGVCHDAHWFSKGKGFIVSAVAGGLKDSVCAEIASNTAVQSAVNYCVARVNSSMTGDEILAIIKESFDKADAAVRMLVEGNPDDYATTLSLAVFSDGTVHCGQIGDSGIIALRQDGFYDCITSSTAIKSDGTAPVFRLSYRMNWQFYTYPHKAKALFFFNGGMRMKTVPPMLSKQQYILDHSYLTYIYQGLQNHTVSECQEWLETVLEAIDSNDVADNDKTLVVVIDEDAPFTQHRNGKDYYGYPKPSLWQRLLKEYYAEKQAELNIGRGVVVIDEISEALVSVGGVVNPVSQKPVNPSQSVKISEPVKAASLLKPAVTSYSKPAVSPYTQSKPAVSPYTESKPAVSPYSEPKPTVSSYSQPKKEDYGDSNDTVSHLEDYPQKKGNLKRNILIVVIILAVIAIAAVCYFFVPWQKLLRRSDNSSATVYIPTQADFEDGISISQTIFTYDKQSHGLSVTLKGEAKGSTVRFGDSEGNYPYSVSPAVTSALDLPITVYYEVSKEGFEPVRGRADISIIPLNLENATVELDEKGIPIVSFQIGGTRLELVKGEDFTIHKYSNDGKGTLTVEIVSAAGNGSIGGRKTVDFPAAKPTASKGYIPIKTTEPATDRLTEAPIVVIEPVPVTEQVLESEQIPNEEVKYE